MTEVQDRVEMTVSDVSMMSVAQYRVKIVARQFSFI